MTPQIIYKYELPNPFNSKIWTFQIHDIFEILSVQKQGETICFWASQTPTQRMIPIKVHCVGTGQTPIFDMINAEYMGTVIDGFYVWHFYMEVMT